MTTEMERRTETEEEATGPRSERQFARHALILPCSSVG